MKYGKKTSILFIALFSILLIWGNLEGISYSKDHVNYSTENVSILHNYEQQSIGVLDRLFPFRTYEYAYDWIGKLKKYKLNVFSNTFSLFTYNIIPIERLKYLKSIELNHWLGFGPESFAWDEKFVSIPSGWVIDYINKKEYTQVYMKVNNKLYRTADHLSSPDVARHFKNSYYKNARFSFSFPVADMNIGENSFSALVILNDGLTYYESVPVKIYKYENGNLVFNTAFLDENDIVDFISITKISMPKNISEVLRYDIDSIDIIDDILVLHCGMFDPQITFPLDEKINKPVGIPYIEIECTNSVEGTLQIFYNFGDGFNEENSIRNKIEEIKEMKKIRCPIIGWIPGAHLVSIRIDPPNGTKFFIKNLEILSTE